MSSLISNISDFLDLCLFPFILDFFESNIGIVFVGMTCICVVLKALASLVRTKF